MIRIVVDCEVCEWCLPVRDGYADQDDADRYIAEQVTPHVNATGHPVRLTIVTRTGGVEERTSFVFSPKEGGPAPEPARHDQ